jgi:hypothetical protein
MKAVGLGFCIALAAALLLTISGCGTPPETEQTTSLKQATGRPVPGAPPASGELSAAPTPQHSASAIWADEIKLLGFDIKPRGKSDYEVSVYYKCLKHPGVDYAMTLHLVPTDAHAITGDERGASPNRDALWWDCQPAPPTEQWQPGKCYRVSNAGIIPRGGAWAIEVGFYRAAEGKVLEVKQRTDPQGAKQMTLRTKPVAIESGS